MPDRASPTILRVFLCHSSGDKPAVRELYRTLKRDGFDPWLDEEKLLPGQKWEREITRAVRESDIVVSCLSNASITKTGYLQKELKFALDVADEQPEGNIFIIPARLEECEIPERLNGLHWVNLFEPDGYARLVRALEHRLQTIDKTPSGSTEESNRGSLLDPSVIDSTDTSHNGPLQQHAVEVQQEERLPEIPRDALPRPPIHKEMVKSFMSRRAIVIGLTAFVMLVIGYWQYKLQGADSQMEYTGRVLHAVTQHPIANAKISVETQGPLHVYYTDTQGIFHLELPKTVDSARIRVEAEGYELLDRNVFVSKAGIEYVLLSPIPIASSTPIPSPEKAEQARSASTPKPQPQRIKVPCSAERRLLGLCSK